MFSLSTATVLRMNEVANNVYFGELCRRLALSYLLIAK